MIKKQNKVGKTRGQRSKAKKKVIFKKISNDKTTNLDTSRTQSVSSYQYTDNLKVEKTLQKNKEVKESDVFDMPQLSK